MYRVYERESKHLVRDNVFLAPNGDIYVSSQGFIAEKLDLNKLDLVSNEDYIWQKSIGVFDKFGKMIFEGDIVKARITKRVYNNNIEEIVESDEICVVSYIPQHASYYMFNRKNHSYYSFDIENISERIEVVGNIVRNNIEEFLETK